MSYPKDLDEYTDDELKDELGRRKQLMLKGLCTYCNRPGETPTCKFPDRHRQALTQ